MQKYLFALGIIALALAYGCSQSKPADQAATAATPATGFRPLQTYCMTCHQSNTLAPSFAEIKTHYLAGNASEAQFTNSFIAFLNQPAANTSKMPEAVQKYGSVMPKLSISEDDMKAIAHFLYHTDLGNPNWAAEQAAQAPQPTGPTNYLAQGQQFALTAKAILGKNLMQAIKTKGTPGAVTFCNTRAIPLTDSMGKATNVLSLKRVSDKPRNPANVANADELAYIRQMHQTLSKGGKAKPQIAEINGNMVGYYPIETNAMCLQCHGTPGKELKPETAAAIAKLYPADQATGYAENQLRGIWVVEMKP